MDTLIAVSRDARIMKKYLMAEEKDKLTLYVNMGWPITLDMGCDPLAPTVHGRIILLADSSS